MLISPHNEACDHSLAVKTVTVLGSTGSIGVNTLDVIGHCPKRFRVVALVAGSNATKLIEQALRFQPEVVAIQQTEMASMVRDALAGTTIRVLSGNAGVMTAATWESASMVVSAIVGAAGLEPTLAAIQAGKDIALANKECLVMAGTLFMEEVIRQKVRLIPVDSEHSAIFQVLFNGRPKAGNDEQLFLHGPTTNTEDIRELVLTASGGPFRGWSRRKLQEVTPAMALAHPSWQMGRKISIDSATMMNKGLEVIEAFHLFGIAAEQIRVVVHPESIVHSMVSYRDGSVLAQMGVPDMRTPIAVALSWPERITTTVPDLDLAKIGQLNFFSAPKRIDFPCLELAYRALHQGGATATVLNAANEIAVAAFLDGKIGFLDISRLIEWTMDNTTTIPPTFLPGSTKASSTGAGSIEEILQTDREARCKAQEWIAQHKR